MTDIPSIFAARQTVPLATRLDDSAVLSQAQAVDRLQVADDDPRLVEPDAMLVLLAGSPRVLCLWPDLTLAWATFQPGSSVADELQAAYAQGRARLEQIHLLHDQPTAALAS